MAYKFQLGSATMSGSLIQEGNLTVSGATMQGQAAMNLDVQGLIKHDGTTIVNADRDLVNLVDIDGTGDLTMGTIGMTGFSVDAVGDTALKSLSVDNSSTIGCDADTDLLTLAAQSITVAADSSITYGGTAITSTGAELNLVDGSSAGTIVNSKAVVYGSSGEVNATTLQIAGSSITATATELNYLDLTNAIGTAGASEAVVLDANKSVTGITNLTASFFKGDGSALTNLDVSGISAAGSDMMVQFNQNGSFAGVATLKYNGSGSVRVSGSASSPGEVSLSGSSAGNQHSRILFGDESNQIYLKAEDDGSLLKIVSSANGIDISGSDDGGVQLAGGDAEEGGVNIVGANGLNGMNAAQDGLNWNISQGGLFSGSEGGKFEKLHINNVQVFNETRELQNVSALDATTEATIEAAIDTLANLTSVGTGGQELAAAGTIDIAQNLMVTGSAHFGPVSGSNFQIAGTLTAENLANATVSLTDDMMVIDDGATGQIKITSLASYATAIAGAGMTSTAGALNVIASSNAGIDVAADAIKLDLDDLAAGAVSVANDSIAIVDADDSNKSKKESIADLVSAMAGAGLTATNGVLSSDASPTPTDHGDDVGTLVEGLNYTDTDFTAARTWTLPASPDAGDIVRVKAPTNAATYNLTIAVAGSQKIDGVAQDLLLESNNAAVSLVYAANNYWVII